MDKPRDMLLARSLDEFTVRIWRWDSVALRLTCTVYDKTTSRRVGP